MCVRVLKLELCCRDLGRQRSSIELDTCSVKPGEMEALEDAVNDRIRAHVPVIVRLLSLDDPDVEKVNVSSLKRVIRPILRTRIQRLATSGETTDRTKPNSCKYERLGAATPDGIEAWMMQINTAEIYTQTSNLPLERSILAAIKFTWNPS